MAERMDLSALTDHSAGWDWENQHVSQSFASNGGLDNKEVAVTDIVESGTVLIAAGPADLSVAQKNKATGATGDGIRIVPIGLVETAQISMNKPLSRIFEIGSILSYIIPGRVVGGISLSRVFFDGPSLLKALYFGEVKTDAADTESKYATFASSTGADKDIHQRMAHIGSGNLAMNLASRFFNHPVGLAFFFKDQESDTVSQIYFEGCQVGSWNMGISANMNVLTEAVNMEFVRCRPIVTKATNSATTLAISDINIVSDNMGTSIPTSYKGNQGSSS